MIGVNSLIVLFILVAPLVLAYSVDPKKQRGIKNEIPSGESDEKFVTFQLFTRNNPKEPQFIDVANWSSLQHSNYQPYRPTKIFVHGWYGIPDKGYIIRDGYFLRGDDCNFICIDWSKLAAGWNYLHIADTNVPLVSKLLTDLLHVLIATGTALETLHLIGFSLGAHVVGNAGATIPSARVNRITGLDPAWPDFSLGEVDKRLDSTDANFVDIIHTKSGHLYEGGLSFLPPIGHVDFYPNGGRQQIGCNMHPISADGGNCDHGRSVDYFAESINNPTGFLSFSCSSWQNFIESKCKDSIHTFMGEPAKATDRGVFYLATNADPPFAQG